MYSSNAQQEPAFHSQKHRMGFTTGYGFQGLNGILRLLDVSDAEKITSALNKNDIEVSDVSIGVEYTYELTFFQIQYYRLLFYREKWSIDIIAEPQFNSTIFMKENGDGDLLPGYEFGFTAGLLYRRMFLNGKLSFYSFISSGPHFISDAPKRQTPGFIFSDNLMIGIQCRLMPKLYVDFRGGIRHISNAGLKDPNGGINNIVLGSGIYFAPW
jgi:hypothetical protein